MTDKCLRYGCIDCIHGHVVAIVSCPSKCQFRKVTGSNNNTTGLVCNIHQDLCTLTCLTILISDIMYFRIMSDIAEMEIYRLADVDFLEGCTKTFT